MHTHTCTHTHATTQSVPRAEMRRARPAATSTEIKWDGKRLVAGLRLLLVLLRLLLHTQKTHSQRHLRTLSPSLSFSLFLSLSLSLSLSPFLSLSRQDAVSSELTGARLHRTRAVPRRSEGRDINPNKGTRYYSAFSFADIEIPGYTSIHRSRSFLYSALRYGTPISA